MDLTVSYSQGGPVLDWGAGPKRCAIGPAGIGVKRAEGDGVTPQGAFPLRAVFYRADRVEKPRTGLALHVIAPDDGWCDTPGDAHYNRLVKLPYGAGAERMWRDDHLYDLVAVIGFNDDPVVAGKGSAIFLHLAKADYAPTAGCVALAKGDLLAALEQLRPQDRIKIG